VTTDVRLLELGNTHEQPLLRKLLLEAPGTFHHSYIVGIISEAASEAVHANPLLARVGALYHDIGKLNRPEYFAENSPDARQKHKELTPEMSTLIISAHPRDGVELGSYYGLPKAVLDFMPEHHGTSCIEYFYHAARELRGEENVREEAFRYPGPRPQRIETAIVMIADSVEAISRQMPDPTRTRLEEMVHKVSMKRLLDRQFDECGLTQRDLAQIEEAMVRVLAGIYHTRPTYPKGKPHPLDLSQPATRVRDGDDPRGTSRTAGGRARTADPVAPGGTRPRDRER
jgi:putative nucleotidyltransferase with HDIG domain